MLDSPVQQIKERLDIVEVISGYVKLQKAGANYRALCPFHSEKTPSFFVSPARQIWHCFGSCSDGGDVFKFVMKIEGIEFGDALRLLAQKAGVELKKQDPKLVTERKRLYEICELATKFFEKQLQESQKGGKVKQYLLDRGLKEDSIKKWRLGLAPDSWQALSDFLKSRDYKGEEIVKAGLAFKTEAGGLRDRFRARIIFPVFDFNSQVVGFGGRVFQNQKLAPKRNEVSASGSKISPAKGGQENQKEQIAKYINTPNTSLYDKSRILYGLDKAKMALRQKDSCILVEGYLDVIMSAQAGLENVVATSGTALTPYQLQILKRYSKNLFLAFDMDPAGDSATKRGIDLAQQQGFNLKVITMPREKDPADIVAGSPEEWQKLVAEAKDIITFYFETTFAKFGDKKAFGPEEKVQIADGLLPVLKRIPNKILQSHWLSELAKKIRAKEEDLETELKKYSFKDRGREKPKEASPSSSRPKKPRREMIEEKILSLILKEPQNLKVLEPDSLSLFSPRCQQILQRLQEAKIDKGNFDPGTLKGFDQPTSEFLNYLALRADFEEGAEKPAKEILSCLRDLKELVVKQELERVSQEIKEAEEGRDFKRLEPLLEKFNQLTQQLK